MYVCRLKTFMLNIFLAYSVSYCDHPASVRPSVLPSVRPSVRPDVRPSVSNCISEVAWRIAAQIYRVRVMSPYILSRFRDFQGENIFFSNFMGKNLENLAYLGPMETNIFYSETAWPNSLISYRNVV